MATYESLEEQALETTNTIQSLAVSGFVPVILQELETGIPLMLKTHTELIEGTLPVSKGGTGLSELGGKRLIASNVDGSSFEEVDILVEHLGGLKENVQDKLDSLRSYTLLVTTGGWVSDSNGYYKEFTISGIKTTDNPIVGLIVTSTTSSDAEKEKYAYSCIDKVDTSTDKVVFRCFDEIPTKEITLLFVCM